MKEDVAIQGMGCTACAIAVEKAVSSLPGVQVASVNFATEKLSVTWDQEALRMSQIKQAIQEAGYTALSIDAKTEDKLAGEKQKESHKQFVYFITAITSAAFIMYIAMGHMIGLPLPAFLHPNHKPIIFALTQAVLCIPAIWAGRKFYIVGVKTFLHGKPNMDTLIAIGTFSALVYSLWSTVNIFLGDANAAMHLYYESVVVIIALVLLGKYLEAKAKGKASESIKKLMGLTPKIARVVMPNGDVDLPIDEVQVGDCIKVRPGEAIPVDGIITEGIAAINESMLTGESLPVDKKQGDKVYAGTINGMTTFVITASQVGEHTAIARIAKLVEEAQGSKAPIANLADKVAAIFVPVIITIAIVSGLLWLVSGYGLAFSVQIFVAVLTIACPCALGLATPVAIMVGTGRGAELGMLIRGGQALENAHRVKAIAFDKTGTLTHGQPALVELVSYDFSEELHTNNLTNDDILLAVSAAAEKNSEHPLGKAIVKSAMDVSKNFLDNGMNIKHEDFTQFLNMKTSEFKATAGMGIECLVGNAQVVIGNTALMKLHNIDYGVASNDISSFKQKAYSIMLVAINKKLAGILALSDTIKASSYNAIKALHDMKITTIMLTGDNKAVAENIASQLGIDKVYYDLLPEQKLNIIEDIKSSYHLENSLVAMVGDGINDAPALAAADIGISICSATDIATESADIVLVHNDITDVANSILLSRKTIQIIKQNLAWAFVYNILGIPMAAGLLYIYGGPLLNPMMAAAAMSLSSVSVIVNALRLKNFKPS